jgi:hypothetical protein
MIADIKLKSSADEALPHRGPLMLHPKRRFKINQPSPKKSVVDAPVPVPSISALPQRKKMKRSGRSHQQQWRTAPEFWPRVPKLPVAPTLHELVGVFMQICMRPAHSHHSTSVSSH